MLSFPKSGEYKNRVHNLITSAVLDACFLRSDNMTKSFNQKAWLWLADVEISQSQPSFLLKAFGWKLLTLVTQAPSI